MTGFHECFSNFDMDQDSSIFEEDYKKLTKLVKHYPAISIVSTEKEPPEKYVLEYRLFGYGSDAAGTVQVARRHQVQLELPFGYPHFPPIVKPLSSIYHPDVDENAVRIADYWQESGSLPDLVVHIGDMIRGKEFTVDRPFNAEAAEWYTKQQHKLPLAELEYVENPESEETRGKSRRSAPIISKKLLLSLVLFCTMAVAAVLLVREVNVLKEVEELSDTFPAMMEERKFQKAENNIYSTLHAVEKILIFRGGREKAEKKLHDLLNSEVLQEGLSGKVLFRGQYLEVKEADSWREAEQMMTRASNAMRLGDIDSATQFFSNAVNLLEEVDLPDVLFEYKTTSAQTRLDYHLDDANFAYTGENWLNARDAYERVLDIITTEEQFISEESAGKRNKIEKLHILASINYYRTASATAEDDKNFSLALQHQKSIINLLGTARYQADPTFSKVLAQAKKDYKRFNEELLTVSASKFLLANYREIFKKHYPGVRDYALQSPQVRFHKYNRGKLVFLLSCIELVSRQSNEYRIYYQKDQATGQWSLYREIKE